MKQFASWFTHGVPGGAALRKSIYESKTGETILAVVERFFESGPINVPVEDASEADELLMACD